MNDEVKKFKRVSAEPLEPADGLIFGSDFDIGVWFRAACTGLWYRSKEAAGDIDAWKEDGVLHVLSKSHNAKSSVDAPIDNGIS